MGVVSRNNREFPTKKSVSSLAKELSEAVDESIEEGNDFFDEYEESDGLPTDEDIENQLAPYDFDIFVDYGDKYTQKGDLPKYHIYKNNQLLAVQLHPYSWDKLQAEYGGGHYKVRMSSSVSGKFIKQQSQHVADVPRNDKEEAQNKHLFDLLGNMNKTLQEQQLRQEQRTEVERRRFEQQMKEQQERLQVESQNQQNQMLTMLTALMSKPKDDSTEKIMAAMQAQSQQNMQMMLAMMEANKGKDNSGDIMQLMMQMNVNTMNLIKEMNQSTSSAFEKIGDKIASMQNQEKGLSGMEMVQLFQNAQAQGFDQMKLLQELADAKAEEKAAAAGGGDDESMTKTLIKSVAPVIGQLASITQNQKAQQPMPSVGYSPNPQNANGTQFPQNQRQAPRQRASGQSNSNAYRQSSKGNTGLPRPKVVKPTQVEPEVVQNQESGKIEGSGQKEKALDILVPFIGQCLIEQKSEQEAAVSSIQKLINAGLDPVVVVPQFSGDELIKIANNAGLHDSEYAGLDNWLKGYYDQIFSITSPEIRESSSN